MDMAHIFVIINSIILAATVILCSIVISLLVQDKKTKEVIKNFLLSLCISDLLRVILGCGFLIRTGTGLKIDSPSCLYEVTLFATSQLASPLVTMVTSLDRYFAIGYPLKYHSVMNEKISRIVIVLNWAFVLLVGSMCIVFRKYFSDLPPDIQANVSSISCIQIQHTVKEGIFVFSSLGITLPSLIVIVVTNIRVYLIMRRVVSFDEFWLFFFELKYNFPFQYAATSNQTSFIVWAKAWKQREIRATFILLLTVINFVLVWTPVICFRIAQVLWRVRISETFIYTCFTVLQIYSLVNPFLYIFTIKHHKDASVRLLKRVCCCKNDVASIDGSNGYQTDGTY